MLFNIRCIDKDKQLILVTGTQLRLWGLSATLLFPIFIFSIGGGNRHLDVLDTILLMKPGFYKEEAKSSVSRHLKFSLYMACEFLIR